MHQQSLDIVSDLLRTHITTQGTVLDVGSCDVNGTYRPLLEGWKYLGVDIAEGPNVDVVVPANGQWDLPGSPFDLVLSGQCLEHAERPWLLFAEMARHVKPGGHLLVVAPFTIHQHRFPIDCWRFLPDGFLVLAKDSGMKVIDVGYRGDDCPHGTGLPHLSDTYMIARKPL